MSEYKKYGDEWEKEVMKNPKKVIVEMLRRVAIERDSLEAAEHHVQRTDCPVCRGRGFNVDWNKNRVQCSTCNGTGISR